MLFESSGYNLELLYFSRSTENNCGNSEFGQRYTLLNQAVGYVFA